MKVYIVIHGEYNDAEIVGAYSTWAKAYAAANDESKEHLHAYMEVYEIDGPMIFNNVIVTMRPTVEATYRATGKYYYRWTNPDYYADTDPTEAAS